MCNLWTFDAAMFYFGTLLRLEIKLLCDLIVCS